MKKLLSILLSIILILSVVSLVGCGKAETLKLGIGTTAYIEGIKSADADTNGNGTSEATVAAVLVDAEGKIVKCAIDSVSTSLGFTSKGQYVKMDEIKTKYELGKDYGMVAYGQAKKEWFEQADAFAALVHGKTIQDVKALVATNGKGNDEVVAAGCTIIISDFVTAVEKAVTNAKESSATAKDSLKLGVVATQTGCKDATEEAEGVNEVDTTVSALALNEGKVTAAVTDAFVSSVTFNTTGVSSLAEKIIITTKLDAGDDYGMSKYGQDLNGDGEVKEWYAQSAAFDAACIGKTADEISALALETGYGSDAVQKAGCTININDMVKAAVKAAK